MFNLISYLIIEIPKLLVTEYFNLTLGITIIIGVLELIFVILNIRRKWWDS